MTQKTEKIVKAMILYITLFNLLKDLIEYVVKLF